MKLKGKYIIFTTCILFLIIGAFSYKNLRLHENEIQEDKKERVTLITEIIRNGLDNRDYKKRARNNNARRQGEGIPEIS